MDDSPKLRPSAFHPPTDAVSKSTRDRDDPDQKWGGNAGTRRTGLAGGNNCERLGHGSRREVQRFTPTHPRAFAHIPPTSNPTRCPVRVEVFPTFAHSLIDITNLGELIA